MSVTVVPCIAHLSERHLDLVYTVPLFWFKLIVESRDLDGVLASYIVFVAFGKMFGLRFRHTSYVKAVFWSFFEMTEKIKSFPSECLKIQATTVVTSFSTTVTQMPQWQKCFSKKWPKCLCEIKNLVSNAYVWNALTTDRWQPSVACSAWLPFCSNDGMPDWT